MGDCRLVAYPEDGFFHKADSGAMNFQVRASPGCNPEITFYSKNDPTQRLYQISINHYTWIRDLQNRQQESKRYPIVNANFLEFQELWVTWYNETIQIGIFGEQEPFLSYKIRKGAYIGFVHFNTSKLRILEWIFETSPVIPKTVPPKKFSDKIFWSGLVDGKLPLGAMIAGFENEPTYVARAHHNMSMCPGKYVPSKNLAYVPWGHREHAKSDFQILCGYNAEWVKTKSNIIPINAFVAGHSEVNQQPLYIGRAMHEGNLLTGKVHVHYKTCYLPYNGKEIETNEYEILVVPEEHVPQAMLGIPPTAIQRTSEHWWRQ